MKLLLQTAWLAAVTIAAPTAHWGQESGTNGWAGSSKESSYSDFGRAWHHGRGSKRGSCDLKNAVMPAAPIPLPPPTAGLTLAHVAIGRGNQNYTCDLSNSTAEPVAAGAVATLFNVSCLAADMPDLLARICPLALDLPVPNTADLKSSPMYQGMSGYHYFKDAKTPFFDLDTSAHAYGNGAFKKGDSTPAPETAVPGPYNSGNGPVAWLRLDAKTSDGQVFKEVYRLNTAGGQPPKTCEGMAEAFEVPYAAEYWLYK